MHWELWDTERNALVATYLSEDEALRGVRDLVAAQSPEYVMALVLGAMYDEDEARHAELPPVLEGEALRQRLVENARRAVTTDVTPTTHRRIREWLTAEGWQLRDAPEPLTSLNLLATLRSGQSVQIFQYQQQPDHITISQHWRFDDRLMTDVAQLPPVVQRDTVWSIYRDATMMGVEFSGHTVPPREMTFRSSVYFDGLTKDVLMQRILLTIRALHLGVRTLARALEAHNLSSEAASRQLHPARRPGTAPARPPQGSRPPEGSTAG
jgi:hypothetical protein